MSELTPVDSSLLAAVGYSGDVLTVQFKKGEQFVYYGVPPQVHEDLMASDSIGRYFLKNIKGKFEYKKL